MFRLRVQGGERSGETFPLAAGEVHVVGRGYDARIRFGEDATMSRVHAELALVGDAWVLRNKSKQGTYVGAVKIDGERLLRGGDEITIGATRFIFEKDPTQGADRATGESTAVPGGGPVTPRPPVSHGPPEKAGYDSQGVFHMGWSFMSAALERSNSSVLSIPLVAAGGPAKVAKKPFQFFAIVTIAAIVGTIVLHATLLGQLWRDTPRLLAIASLLAIVPTIPYLAAFKLLDRNAQIPLRNYLACFFWGATVGCSASAVLSTLAIDFFSAFVEDPKTGSLLTTIFAAPIFEETTKGLAVLAVFYVLHDEFDNAVEGMLLGAASGLGFALVENLIYDARFLVRGMQQDVFLWNGTYRALTCALVGHPVYTAMTGLGFGLARELDRKRPWRSALPIFGWLVAVLMHTAWNAASVFVPRWLGRGVKTEVLLALFVGGSCAAFFIAVLAYSLARERRILKGHLADEVEKGFIEKDELASFEQLFGREKFVFAGIPRGTYKLRKELRRAQLELAFRKWHLLQGDSMKGKEVDRILLDARIRIRDARNAINAKEKRKVVAES